MPDKMTIHEDLGIIEIHSYGTTTHDDIANTMSRTLQAYETRKLNKVIVDVTRLDEMPDTLSIFQLFSNIPSGIKTALYGRTSQKIKEDLMFAACVAANRGTPVKVFFDREAALEWLTD